MELISKDEKAELQRRLRELTENRHRLSERIAEARELGDLKENAEYHAAREQQGLEEAEIRRLEDRIAKAQVVDGSSAAKQAQVAFLGSTVKLKELDTGDIDEYRLVGEASLSPPLEYVEVTVNSPMGEALMKSRVGEVIKVRAPRGVKSFQIIEIR